MDKTSGEEKKALIQLTLDDVVRTPTYRYSLLEVMKLGTVPGSTTGNIEYSDKAEQVNKMSLTWHLWR